MRFRSTTSHTESPPARRRWGASRWAAVGAAVAVTLGGGGLLTASAASTSSDDASSTITIVPCRFLDTRLSTGERTSPIGGGETVTLPAFGTHGGCTIPTTATALVANVTAVNPSHRGYLTVFPGGAQRPTTSMLNWSAGDGATPNQVIAKLSTAGSFSMFNFVGTVDVVIDVVAYLVPASSDTGGATGATGATGASGADGTDGADGVDGVDGADGIDGTNGVSGYYAAAPGPNTAIAANAGIQTITVKCVPGRYALSGGVSKWGQGADLTIHQSYPVSELIDGKYVATGWIISVSTIGGGQSGAAPWVICANVG